MIPNAQVYGIPISFETYILFYNKDLVSAVPATFPDLIADAQRITAEKGGEGISGSVMRGIRSDTIMDTLSGVVWNSFGAADAPTPYGMWFDGAWDKPRLTDERVCGGLANYGNLLAAGPANKFAIDWPDANTLFSQGKAAYFIDASLFGPSYEDPTVSQVAGKVGYAVLPPPAAGAESFTGHWLWGLGIPKSAANKDAAWYFIQWMTDKAQHGRDRQEHRRRTAPLVLLGPGLHLRAQSRVHRHREQGHGDVPDDRRPQGRLEGRRARHRRHGARDRPGHRPDRGLRRRQRCPQRRREQVAT